MAATVTCVMPTRDRPEFVAQAIRYFQRQDYPERELLVVDDSAESVADLMPSDRRVRYIRVDTTGSLGAKRNIANDLARGELIAHWDDDDWMAPQRLSLQVDALGVADADVCGTRDLLYYSPGAGQAWVYRYPDQGRPWLAGGTLLYRREVWRAHPFPDVTVGEDGEFLRRLGGARLHAMRDASFYVGIIHSRNTAGKNTATPRWERLPLGEVTQLLAEDRDFYASLRRGTLPAETARARPPSVNIAGHYDVSTGYGTMAEYTAVGMERAGAVVNVVPMSAHPEGISAEFQSLLRRSRPEPDAPTLFCSWPSPDLQRFVANPNLFIDSMWEASRLPAGWADSYNHARAIIAPSRFVARVFRDSGVTVPIEVVPEGVDRDVYFWVDRPHRDGITTLTIGPIDDRKHVREGIAAWKLAFAGDPDARLIIKTRYGYHNYAPDDPRIRYVDEIERTRGIMHWYLQADVLLALGNEGFGLPLIEAMATGLPVIALNAEGQADVCADAPGLLLPVDPVGWQDYNSRAYGRCGVQAVPGVADVAARLRWVAEHRDEAREMGRAASAWVHAHRDVWQKGPAVLDVMERHATIATPLRRAPSFWTPSLHTPCGVADYTESLAAAMPGARASAATPHLRAASLLHVQHEPTLFDDEALAGALRRAAAGRVTTAVTLHAVDHVRRVWEQEADGFVSLSARGADMLRLRWQDKSVAHIPPGCPNWFPPRKRRRGRVIGAFGFMGRHKGFWHLLEALRRLEGSELLLFSHARSAKDAEAWRRASEGLPVRHVSAFLPTDEIARRLAAEADVLAFWYSDIPYISISTAARVGLASGVPVLTSRAAWFEGLEKVTVQSEDLVEGLDRLLEDTALRDDLTAAAREYCDANRWDIVAERYKEFWRGIERN